MTTQAVSVPYPAAHLLETAVDGETVVYDSVHDVLHRLDPVATRVWRQIDGGRTIDELIDGLASGHQADAARVRADLTMLLTTLRAAGLLATDSQSTPRFSVPTTAPDESLPSAGQPAPHMPPARQRLGPYSALRHRFTVDVDNDAEAAFLAETCSGLRSSGSPAAPTMAYRLIDLVAPHADRYWLLLNDQTLTTTPWRARALAVLLWHINQQAVRRSIDDLVVIHAAAADSNGVLVVLPAPMGGGKTTTVAGLLQAGFAYVTDEAVALDPRTLLVEPYPKALSVDVGAWTTLAALQPLAGDVVTGQWQVPPLAFRRATTPSRPRLLLAPAYVPGTATRLVPMTRGEMLVHIANSSFSFRQHPARDLAVLTRLVEGCDCYRMPVGNLDTAVRLVRQLVDRSASSSAP